MSSRIFLLSCVVLLLGASVHASKISSHLHSITSPAQPIATVAAEQAVDTARATVQQPALATTSACAPTFTDCGSHPLLTAQSVSAVCCPAETVCQRTAYSFRCVRPEVKSACDTCCATGKCTHSFGSASEDTVGSSGMLAPALTTFQCCGSSAGASFCCPTRTQPTPEYQQGKSQKCAADADAWKCEDKATMMSMSVSLYAWQIALFVVGGVLLCGCIGGGGHRAHGGHCSNDCQACTACLAGCAIFECCMGKGGANAPLLG